MARKTLSRLEMDLVEKGLNQGIPADTICKDLDLERDCIYKFLSKPSAKKLKAKEAKVEKVKAEARLKKEMADVVDKIEELETELKEAEEALENCEADSEIAFTVSAKIAEVSEALIYLKKG